MRTAAGASDRSVGFKEASPEKRALTKEPQSSSLTQTTGKSGHKKRHHEKVNIENESPVKKHLHSGGQENNENALSTSSAKKLGKENAALGIRRRKNERAQAAIASAQKKGNASLQPQSETVDTFNPVNEVSYEDKAEKDIDVKEDESNQKEEVKAIQESESEYEGKGLMKSHQQ